MFFLEKLRKFCKICDEILLNFSGRSGAKECRVPCIPVRVILIFSSYCIPVSFALFDHFLLGSGCLGLFAFSFRLVSAWFFPVVFYLTDSKGAKGFESCRFRKMLENRRRLRSRVRATDTLPHMDSHGQSDNSRVIVKI